jgi:four helix bundle protein
MTGSSIKCFEDLEVWQRSHQLVLAIYKETKNYPSEERFGLVSQMRRAAVSIPCNIAEGFRRKGLKTTIYFYNVAHASLDELRYQLILSRDLGYITDDKSYISQVEIVSKMLSKIIHSISVTNIT